MPPPTNRHVPLSPSRRLVCDVMHFSQKVPLVMVRRRMHLGDVVLARKAAKPRPSWFAVFIKAYAVVALRWPELRRSYMTIPWPRLFEHARNIASVPIERYIGEEPVVCYVPFPSPEERSLAELDAIIVHHKERPIKEISFFRTQLWMSRLPQPLRRLIWWLGLNLWGRVRAYFYGTFGVTSVGTFGADVVTLQSPLTSTLTYGAFDPDGSVTVSLCFDHRVMDGALPARALAELEGVLKTLILEELRACGVATAA
jgi:hypothetical protein